jgi:hypothetical protein
MAPRASARSTCGASTSSFAALRKRLPALRPLSEDLVTAVSLAQRNFQVLCHDVERYAEKDLHCDRRQRRTLKAQGQSLREISRLLKLSRHTVRSIVSEPAGERPAAPPCDAETLAMIEDAFQRAGGNGVRVQQLLASDHDQIVPYSTLTHWIRAAELRTPPQRSGEYHLHPGEEMQHDTFPHRLELDRKSVKGQCTGLVLGYSRRLFFQYYPRYVAPKIMLRNFGSARSGTTIPDVLST